MISGAFKIDISKDVDINEIKLPLTGPNISFVGRISSKAEQIDDDCRFSIDLLEYNNFNFGNKEKMIFKIQVVFEAGPNSRFRKLATRLDIGKLIFITGFLDLDDNEIFVEAKEIDLLDDSISNQLNINSKSPFSRTNKFKNNGIKKEKDSDNIIEVINDQIHEKTQNNYINISDNDIKQIEKPRKYGRKRKSPTTLVQNQKKTKDSDITDKDEDYEIISKKNSGKKKDELMDLSIHRLNNFINDRKNDEIDEDENQANDSKTKKVEYMKKNTNVTTRSQKSKDEE